MELMADQLADSLREWWGRGCAKMVARRGRSMTIDRGEQSTGYICKSYANRKLSGVNALVWDGLNVKRRRWL